MPQLLLASQNCSVLTTSKEIETGTRRLQSCVAIHGFHIDSGAKFTLHADDRTNMAASLQALIDKMPEQGKIQLFIDAGPTAYQALCHAKKVCSELITSDRFFTLNDCEEPTEFVFNWFESVPAKNSKINQAGQLGVIDENDEIIMHTQAKQHWAFAGFSSELIRFLTLVDERLLLEGIDYSQAACLEYQDKKQIDSVLNCFFQNEFITIFKQINSFPINNIEDAISKICQPHFDNRNKIENYNKYKDALYWCFIFKKPAVISILSSSVKDYLQAEEKNSNALIQYSMFPKANVTAQSPLLTPTVQEGCCNIL